MHGKPSWITHRNAGVFAGLPEKVKVGRYHSLYAIREKLPEVFEITAESDDGVIMGVRHRDLPVEAVQFHPESLLSMDGQHGVQIVRNMVRLYGHVRKQTQP
jgi:anthranilate synthase